MWRIVSLKSLLCLVIVVVGLVVLIMSRSSNRSLGARNNNFKSLDFTAPESQEDVEMHYYSNNRYTNNKQDKRAIEFEQNPKDQIGDYPFEENENDFDPLSAPGEDLPPKKSKTVINNHSNKGGRAILDDITCDVNHGKYSIPCKKSEDSDEVYVPFSFIRKYYEVFGIMSEQNSDTFMWFHSPPVKIYRQKKAYDPKGVFAFFDNYNVEVRDRVKCISGSTGVPVSTQWDVNGYFYPIQIAQFGLSHYSKHVTEKPPVRVMLENGQDVRGMWELDNEAQILRTVPDSDNPSNQVVVIKAGKDVQGIGNDALESGLVRLSLETVQHHLLLLSISMRSTKKISKLKISDKKESSGINVTITVKVRYDTQEFYLHYVTDDFYIKVQNNHIFHGLGSGSQGHWQHIIRDIGVDIQKGITLTLSGTGTGGSKKKSQKMTKSKLIIDYLSISNINSYDAPLLIDNLTLSSTEHLSQFFQAVDWFVENQDSHGGWPIPVSRKFNKISNFYPTLRPGWYSAMGQGHGLSLLSRAYAVTQNPKYSDACEKALRTIFDHTGLNNLGVRASFLDQYTWYEEYPTIPSSFVLNGFMYALLGLYDVQKLQIPSSSEKSLKLYNDGLQSLIKMLPLYDTGDGTFYDLRHFTVPGIAPNLARLDYHVTHINQLLIFASIHQNPIFLTTAERWIRYIEGERAPHN